jgi:ferritin-like metal-binding protein YciE
MPTAATPAKKNTTKKSPVTKQSGPLRELFLHGLKDIYWAEKALTKAIPKLSTEASSQKLKSALNEHLEQTKGHVDRLEKVFSALGEPVEAVKCDGMEGLIKEGDGVVKETEPGAVRDAGIIGACQKVEHYEIATYGTLAAYAKLMNEKEALSLLLKTLGEEKKSDQLLSAIADTHLNAEAMK